MKTMTLKQFKDLVARTDWTRSQYSEVVETLDRPEHVYNELTDDIDETMIPHSFGWICKTSELDGIEINYVESFNYDNYEPESFSASTEGQNEVWEVRGVRVLDEDDDNDEVLAHDLADYLPHDFSEIDYSEITANIAEIDDYDIDEGSDMETIKVLVDNAPDIRFSGEEIAHASSHDNRAMGGNYSGNTGRWSELTLYKTSAGNYVCESIGRTRWQGEHDRFNGLFAKSEADVIDFFGHGWLAKELYESAGISDAVTVD